MEKRRIVDHCEATAEIPMSPLLRQKLKVPASQLTRIVDISYLILSNPSDSEKHEIEMAITSALTNSGYLDSDLERSLRDISLRFLDYPNKYKLIVLSRAREPSGKNNISCYNTDEILEFDGGGGPQLLPDDIEASTEIFEFPYQSVDRYGHLFSIVE